MAGIPAGIHMPAWFWDNLSGVRKSQLSDFLKTWPIDTHFEICVRWFAEYGNDISRFLGYARFWKTLYAGCYKGDKKVVDFIMSQPTLHVNKNRNQFHLTLLGCAFRGNQEETVLRLLDHPKMNINKNIRVDYHQRQPLLIHAIQRNMPQVLRKLLDIPSIDINKASQKVSRTRTEREIFDNDWLYEDIYSHSFSIIDEFARHRNKCMIYFPEVLDRPDVITDLSRAYYLAAAYDNREALEQLHKKKEMTVEQISRCLYGAIKYRSNQTFDFLRGFYSDVEFKELLHTFFTSYNDLQHIWQSSSSFPKGTPKFHFLETIFDLLPETTLTEIFSHFYDEDLLLLWCSKKGEPYPDTSLEGCLYRKHYRLAAFSVGFIKEDHPYYTEDYLFHVLAWGIRNIRKKEGRYYETENHFLFHRRYQIEPERGCDLNRRIHLKQFLLVLNAKLRKRYLEKVRAVSEVTLFSKLSRLPCVLWKKILDLDSKNVFLTKEFIQSDCWRNYTTEYIWEDVDPWVDDLLVADEILTHSTTEKQEQEVILKNYSFV